ncbi:unnamed protein product [Toxocara canis]|uniref:Uncharacterized protein n=1 Tax=Toxocara canis TaxID=6265 RepID=A0A183UWS2_TOXCA|nr:unnamed protein product [Toxocara canis]
MREQPVRTAYYPPVSSRMHASEPRVPIAFRTAEAAYQQNRLLTPFLAARMVHQKKYLLIAFISSLFSRNISAGVICCF